MKRNYQLQLKFKKLLFLCHESKTIDLAEDVLNLTKEVSSLLQSWKFDGLGDFSEKQLWAYVDECCRVNQSFYKGLVNKTKQGFYENDFYTKRKKGALRASCYFCSQPVLFSWFNKSKAVVHNKILSVISCRTCREGLKNFKKINVLYFFYDKKRVHWSECCSYRPKFNYWLMNQAAQEKEERKGVLLKLVVNNKDRVLQ